MRAIVVRIVCAASDDLGPKGAGLDAIGNFIRAGLSTGCHSVDIPMLESGRQNRPE
jgi:hypothetical protein